MRHLLIKVTTTMLTALICQTATAQTADAVWQVRDRQGLTDDLNHQYPELSLVPFSGQGDPTGLEDIKLTAFDPFQVAKAVRSDDGRSAFVSLRSDTVWREAPGYTDRFSVTTRRRLTHEQAPPLAVLAAERASYTDDDAYDVRFTRGWAAAQGYTESGLEVELTPHAGVGVSDQGNSAEAGATLKIGSGIIDSVRDGDRAFGDRMRWYLYAAGSGRAVGYNFARNRDGRFDRSGVSHDSGSFLGDASVGVALRRGDVQGSFGYVYREIEAKGLRGGQGFDRDVTEGLVAFQLSIKPEW